MTQPPAPPEPQPAVPGVPPAVPPPAPDPAPAPTEPEPAEQEPPAEAAPPAEPEAAAAETAHFEGSVQLPGALQPHPDAGTEEPQQVAHPGVSNVSPTLSPGVQGSAAKAWGALTHIENVVKAAKADIERFVPPEVLALGETEVQALIRSFI